LLDADVDKGETLSSESLDARLLLDEEKLWLLDTDDGDKDEPLSSESFDARQLLDEEQFWLLDADGDKTQPLSSESLDAWVSREDEFAMFAELEVRTAAHFSEREDDLDSIDKESHLIRRVLA